MTGRWAGVKRYTPQDNRNLDAKVGLRRHFLDRYHAGGGTISVLDCCEGEGKIWDELERWYPLWRWGVDLKPAPGRLRVDSEVLLAGDVPYDVVDVDTYGGPWSHYVALITHNCRPVTVFLTYGQVGICGGGVDPAVYEGLGIVFPTVKPSQSLMTLINRLGGPIIVPRMIGLAWEHGLRVVEAAEVADPGTSSYGGNNIVRYIGVRLEPAGGAA
jgi:hypothetical protein